MPTDKEKVFFLQVFRLMDQRNKTHWAEAYSRLESQTDDGQINWGQIPGFLKEPYRGKGYRKAVNKIVSILIDFINNCYNEEDDFDLTLQVELEDIVASAKKIYESRQRALSHHRKGKNDDEELARNAGHDVACSVWKEAKESLQEAFQIQQVKRYNSFNPDESVQRITQQNSRALAIEVMLAVGLAACIIAALFFVFKFLF